MRQTLLNVLNLGVLLVLVILVYLKQDTVSEDIDFISILSFSILLYQCFILHKVQYGLLSFQTIFIILSALFNFSFFWLISIGKSDFIFFPNWMYTDIPDKCSSALYAMMCIQAVFTGLVWKRKAIRESVGEDNAQRNKVFIIGVIMLIIGLPFKLYYDYLNIMNSIANGGYSGFSGVVGLVDDFQHFAVAGLITIIASGYKTRRFYVFLMLIVFAYFLFVMTASGDRRYYITAVLGVVMAYVGSLQKQSTIKKGNKLVTYLIIAFVFVFLSNVLALIRNTRFIYLGSDLVAQGSIEQLMSLDGIWETLGEFGITLNALLVAREVIPTYIPFQYGASYLYALIYVLPIGSFVKIPNASIGNAVTSFVDIPVGSSFVLDLYANFNLFAFLPGIVIGMLLSQVINGNRRIVGSERLALSCSFSYILINYVRASTSEVLRPVVYIAVLFLFLDWLLLKIHSK